MASRFSPARKPVTAIAVPVEGAVRLKLTRRFELVMPKVSPGVPGF
jgi:hypothetical protein